MTPIIQFYLHEKTQDKKEDKKEDVNLDENRDRDFKSQLIELCNDLLSQDDLEQIGDDYKLQLIHLSKKINAISADKSYSHGLFGKLHDKFGDISDLKGAKAYIDQKFAKLKLFRQESILKVFSV